MSDGAFAITQRTDPSLETLERNRYILGGIWTAGGIGIAALGSPFLGAAVAAGGVTSMLGTKLTLLLGKVLDKPAQQANNQGAVYGQLGAYYAQMGHYKAAMGAYKKAMGSVYGQMGAVYGQMGAARRGKNVSGGYVPAPNWASNAYR